MKWKILPLEEFSTREDGAIKIGPFGSQLKKCDLVPAGIHVVGIENVIEEKFDGLGERYITPEKYESLKSVEVRPGDLLITMMGTVGEVAIVPLGTRTSVMDSHLLRFRPNLGVCSPRFVAWLIKGSPIVRAAIQARAHGAIMKGLNSSLIRTLPAPLPPLSAQEQIVKLLDDADELRKLRAQADRRTAALIPSVFHEMFGDPDAKNWKEQTFGDAEVMQIIDGDRGTNYPKKTDFRESGHCLFLNTSNVRKGAFDFSKCDFITREKDNTLRKGKLMRGDVILTTRGTLGNSAHYDNAVVHENVRINSGMVILRTNPALLPEYLLVVLNSDGFTSQVNTMTSGSAQPQLPVNRLSHIKFILPPLPLQEEFAQRVTEIRDLEAGQVASRVRLENLFQSILHRAFNGEL